MITIIKTFAVPGIAVVVAFIIIMGSVAIGRWVADIYAKDVYGHIPVVSEPVSDNVIPEYIENVHQQTAVCDELAKTLEKCDRVLGECLSILESHHLVSKQDEEKNSEETEETNER